MHCVSYAWQGSRNAAGFEQLRSSLNNGDEDTRSNVCDLLHIYKEELPSELSVESSAIMSSPLSPLLDALRLLLNPAASTADVLAVTTVFTLLRSRELTERNH